MRALPRGFVLVLVLPLAAALGALGGCNKPLDEDQCGKLVDKMVDLAAADEPSGANTEKLKADVKGDRRT
ncbi:MAG: hypothetical protein ABI175_02065, partial [Polyangiales bacterium]